MHLFKSYSFFKTQFNLHPFPKAFQNTLAKIISPLTEFKEMFFTFHPYLQKIRMMLASKSFIVLPFTCGLKLARYVVGSRSTTFSFLHRYIVFPSTLVVCLFPIVVHCQLCHKLRYQIHESCFSGWQFYPIGLLLILAPISHWFS